MKEKIKLLLENVRTRKHAIVGFVAAASPLILSVSASAAGETGSNTFTAPSISDSISNVDFTQLLDQMVDILPVILPVLVSCLAFCKGINFLKSMIIGA